MSILCFALLHYHTRELNHHGVPKPTFSHRTLLWSAPLSGQNQLLVHGRPPVHWDVNLRHWRQNQPKSPSDQAGAVQSARLTEARSTCLILTSIVAPLGIERAYKLKGEGLAIAEECSAS